MKPEDVEKSIEWAFEQWSTYMDTKQLVNHKVARRVEKVTKCDGKVDLRVHLGTTDEVVEKLKKGYMNPIAFSEKTTYDEFKGRGKGVLWVTAPRKFGYTKLDWTDLTKFRAILLHEVGHVFGNSHISGTIMDDHLGYRVLGQGGPSGDALNLPVSTIDGRSREVARCPTCTYELESGGHNQLQTRFTKLVGTPPKGRATATMRVKEVRGKHVGVITLKDDAGSYPFPFEVEKQIAWRNGDSYAFQIISPPDEPSYGALATGTGVWYGFMTTPKGLKLPISFARALSYAVEVVDLDGPVPQDHEDDSDFFHGHSFKILKNQ